MYIGTSTRARTRAGEYTTREFTSAVKRYTYIHTCERAYACLNAASINIYVYTGVHVRAHALDYAVQLTGVLYPALVRVRS